MKFLETERIELRNFQEQDLEDIYHYAKEEGVGEKAGWLPHQNIEESRAILYKVFLPNPDDYAIVDKASGHVIGSFGLHISSIRCSNDFPEEKVKELGYVLSKDYWGKGIMTEILTSAIEKWKEEKKADVLTAVVFSDNFASIHVLEKCGFHHYKILKDVYHTKLEKNTDELCFYRRISE